MLRRCLILLLAFASPAGAETYLVQAPGDSEPSMVWTDSKPPAVGGSPGVEAGSLVSSPWKPFENHMSPRSYKINPDGSTVYNPPASSETLPVDSNLEAIYSWLKIRADELTKDQYSELSRILSIPDKAKRDASYAEIEPSLPK